MVSTFANFAVGGIPQIKKAREQIVTCHYPNGLIMTEAMIEEKMMG